MGSLEWSVDLIMLIQWQDSSFSNSSKIGRRTPRRWGWGFMAALDENQATQLHFLRQRHSLPL